MLITLQYACTATECLCSMVAGQGAGYGFKVTLVLLVQSYGQAAECVRCGPAPFVLQPGSIPGGVLVLHR